MRTLDLEIDVRIDAVINENNFMSDNRFTYTTGDDFSDFLNESKQELIEQLCSFYTFDDVEGDFEQLEETLQSADYEVTWEVKEWGEVSDYDNLQDIEILNEIAENDVYSDFDVISAGIYLGISIDNIDEAYKGSYSDDESFACDFAEEIGAIEKNVSWPYTCIDWEQAAKELMYDYSEQGGHYFRNL